MAKGKGKGKKVGCREKNDYFWLLFHPRGYVMYNPSRVARQCGYVQKIPKEHKMFKNNETKTKSYDNDIYIVHKPLPSCDYWEDRALHRYPLNGPSRTDDEAIPDYMSWNLNVSHTRVIRVNERPKIEDKYGSRMPEKPSRVLDNPSKATNQGRDKC